MEQPGPSPPASVGHGLLGPPECGQSLVREQSIRSHSQRLAAGGLPGNGGPGQRPILARLLCFHSAGPDPLTT